jgi:hypothetical protein
MAKPLADLPHDPAPLYDPAVHTVEDGDPKVYVELFCLCGGIFRQRDPVSYVKDRAARFIARHSGKGHGEATKAACVESIERIRHAAHVMHSIEDEYAPKDRPNLHIDDQPRPWPTLGKEG